MVMSNDRKSLKLKGAPGPGERKIRVTCRTEQVVSLHACLGSPQRSEVPRPWKLMSLVIAMVKSQGQVGLWRTEAELAKEELHHVALHICQGCAWHSDHCKTHCTIRTLRTHWLEKALEVLFLSGHSHLDA